MDTLVVQKDNKQYSKLLGEQKDMGDTMGEINSLGSRKICRQGRMYRKQKCS